MKTRASSCPEPLEARIAPAVHTWTGGGADNLWSNAANWTGGSPAADASGNIDLVFPTGPAKLTVQNDIAALVVDSITFSAVGGTSANGYTINGNIFGINTGATGENPFGINVATGVADPTNGITQVFNTPITLLTTDATFRTLENNSRLTFNGDINLGGRTLTIDAAGLFDAVNPSFLIAGDISNGSLVKNSDGTLQLTGNNSFTNLTASSGTILADTNTALGATTGTIALNDPAVITLRNGITVVKTTLNLNSNALNAFGANGNTTNTFRGSVVLMAGSGGVAFGAGVGVANADTRLIVDGVISGATSFLSLNGPGVIEFTRDNTYTGFTNPNGNNGFGALQIDSPGGLGASSAGNGVQLNRNGGGPTGSALWLNFTGTMAEPIFFAASGVGGLGAIRVLGDNDVELTGSITHIAGAPWVFGVDSADGSLTTTGVIDSQGANRALTKTGAGTLVIGGTAANTYVGGTIINGGIVRVENTSASPLGAVAGVVTVNNTGTLRVETGSTIPNAVQLNAGGTLAGFGAVSGTITSTSGIISPGASAGSLFVGNLALNAASTFVAEINGTTPGTTHDQVEATGVITLGGAKLSLPGSFTAAAGTNIVLIENSGGSAVNGNFADLPEGTRFVAGGQMFSISYVGGSGNDVVLTTVDPVNSLVVSADGRSATFTDDDGDLVTMKLTKGAFDPTGFLFAFTADSRQQLQQLTLDAATGGANVTITAKRSANGGTSFTNLGYLNATGVDLGTVSVDGDLGRIDAGAVKSLTVQSLGAFGTTTQAAGGNLVSNLTGNLGKLTVKASIHGATLLGTGSIGPVKINGSFLGGRLSAGADLGAVTVRGDIVGTESAPVIISGFGKAVAPTTGKDLAIKSLRVGGGVEFLRVLAGYDLALAGLNADASSGAISVGADWRASTVLAGVSAGADGFAGTADDAKLTTTGVRDTATIFSSIASITIKGQALGSIAAGDTFGIVAEQITKAKVGKAVLKFDKGERDAADAFALAATGPGATALASDFFLREAIV